MYFSRLTIQPTLYHSSGLPISTVSLAVNHLSQVKIFSEVPAFISLPVGD